MALNEDRGRMGPKKSAAPLPSPSQTGELLPCRLFPLRPAGSAAPRNPGPSCRETQAFPPSPLQAAWPGPASILP